MLVISFASSIALATEDDDSAFKFPEDRTYATPLSPQEIYSRTLSVLQYYHSPALPSGQEELTPLDGFQSYSNLKHILQYFDADKMFNRLFTANETEFKGYDDLDGKSKTNFKVSLQDSSLRQRLKHQSTPTQPLRGLRVAIDPGHMGEDFWDKLTGKYIRDSKGNYLSEGVINLQTSLLVQSELQALGAEVTLSRMGMTSATDMKLEDLPLKKFAKRELLEHVYSSWFLKLLSSGTGSSLFSAFDKSSERKKLFSESNRSNYFILKEDIQARVQKMNEFDPDIVLIIHYDVLPSGTDGHGLNPQSPNQTKAYVSGAYLENEFGSKASRSQFAKKLLNQTQWDESLSLSRKIITELKTQMGLDVPKSAQNSIPVESGIFSRNLNLPRSLNAPAVAYLECLFYNRPEEFYAFSDAKHPMIINGINYPYSDRLQKVADSIKQGVVNYISSHD